MMSLPDTFSRRNRAVVNDGDVFTYDDIPNKVRVQTTQILKDAIGPYYDRYGNLSPAAMWYDYIVKHLRREQGVHALIPYAERPSEEFFLWLEKVREVISWLDGLEVALRVVDRAVRKEISSFSYHIKANPDDAIEEINARLLEARVGYQYVSGSIVRMDHEYVHRDVVLPSLRVLRDPKFQSAEREYLLAHAAYMDGSFEDALVNCAKALESVLKVIGHERGWEISDTDSASRLIARAAEAGFLLSHMQTSTNHLRGLIESSTPTIRNKHGGHGAGREQRDVPRHLVSLQLHQTAAILLFLVEQHRLMPLTA